MDHRRHGKRALVPESSEDQDDDSIFPVYSARSQEDMSAMVSALSQVIGASSAGQFYPSVPVSASGEATQQIQSSQPTRLNDDQQGVCFSIYMLPNCTKIRIDRYAIM